MRPASRRKHRNIPAINPNSCCGLGAVRKRQSDANVHLSLFIFFAILGQGRGGTEESAVPLARDLHPEFGYIGNAPAVLRKLGFAIAFVGVGLIAAITNFSIFVSEPEDPMKAMALAPEQGLNNTAPSAPSLPASFTEEGGATSRPCGGAITAESGVDCLPTRMHRSRPTPSVNERPAIAAVAIGHRDESALPAAPAAAVPADSTNAAVSASPPDAPAETAAAETPAEAVAPPAPARKVVRTRPHRERSEYARASSRGPSYSYSYHSSAQSGYARVW